MSNLLGKMTTGGKMNSNWTETRIDTVVEARTLNDMSSASKKCEANGLRNRPENLAMPKDLEIIGMQHA